MNKINKNDEFVRRAIWEAHKYRSFYTGKPIDYTDMEIDHIIPKSYKDKEDDLKRIFKECGLDNDFELDSLFNLVPVSKYENRRKSNKELSTRAIIYYLELAREKAPIIEEKIDKFRKQRNYDKHISMLKTYVTEEDDGQKRDKILDNIFSLISDDNEDFKEEEKLYNKERELIFRKYTKSIGLKAIMPKYDDPETICVLNFRNLKLRNCIVRLDNRTVLSQLFIGLFTDPKYGTRGFIEYEKLENKNNDVIDLDKVSIYLGNNKIKLFREDIYNLCDLVDAYALKYIELIKNIENILKTHSYQLSKRRSNYKLITISYNNWLKLVDFAYRHDVDNGKSKWHIFDRNPYYLKVYTNKKHVKYDTGFHAFFHAEFSEDIVLYPVLSPPKEVCITFEFLEELDKVGVDCINERESWNAEISYKWLINELLPKVLGNNEKNKILSRNEKRYNNILETNKDFERVYYLKNKEINKYNDLYEIITLLQIHYHSRAHSKYRVKKSELEGIYNSILKCILKSKRIDLHYISSKLGLNHCKTVSELIDSVKHIIEEIDDMTINGFGIDYLFRALLIAIESKKINLSLSDMCYIRDNIDFFIETYDREVLLEKYAVEFVY